jgi:uncharacterized membrane protein affecting hemolysin expression
MITYGLHTAHYDYLRITYGTILLRTAQYDYAQHTMNKYGTLYMDMAPGGITDYCVDII